MWKFRVGVIAASSVFALATGTAAWASSGGNSNAGDVWLDNVGQPAGPGHEMDPHLACQDINLWGSGLADSSGSFAIDGWQPSGSQEVDYSGNWSYDQSPSRKSGDQVIAVINVSQLISQAQANGDTPSAQGYHFKLDFSQDPQKHKTFWVNCPSSSGSTPSSTSSSSSSPTTSTSSSTPTGSVKAAHKVRSSRRKHHALRKHKLVKPKRHHVAARRSVSAVSTTAPAFTG
jgi:hypothetical protein